MFSCVCCAHQPMRVPWHCPARACARVGLLPPQVRVQSYCMRLGGFKAYAVETIKRLRDALVASLRSKVRCFPGSIGSAMSGAARASLIQLFARCDISKLLSLCACLWLHACRRWRSSRRSRSSSRRAPACSASSRAARRRSGTPVTRRAGWSRSWPTLRRCGRGCRGSAAGPALVVCVGSVRLLHPPSHAALAFAAANDGPISCASASRTRTGCCLSWRLAASAVAAASPVPRPAQRQASTSAGMAWWRSCRRMTARWRRSVRA